MKPGAEPFSPINARNRQDHRRSPRRQEYVTVHPIPNRSPSVSDTLALIAVSA